MSDIDDIVGPQTMRGMIGQLGPRQKLQTMASGARDRGESTIRATALIGPGGTGKTLLARMLAALLDTQLVETMGGAVNTVDDLRAWLMKLPEFAVAFIDEFHNVPPNVREKVLYSAISDGVLYVKAKGEGTGVIELPPFSLVVATTNVKFSPSMARRFTRIDLDYYTDPELAEIITRKAKSDGLVIDRDAAAYLAVRSQGVAGVAEQLLADAYDELRGSKTITLAHVTAAMELSRIDQLGLGVQERKILDAVADEAGEPIGLDSIEAVTGMRDVDDMVDFLTRIGLLRLAPGKRGRVATVKAYEAYRANRPVPPAVRGLERGSR